MGNKLFERQPTTMASTPDDERLLSRHSGKATISTKVYPVNDWTCAAKEALVWQPAGLEFGE